MALLLSTAPARAQVTVDLQALDKLPGAHPATKHQATQKSKPRRVATAKPQSQKAAEKPATEPPTATASLPPTVSPSSPQPPPATLPTAPPDTVALVPPPPAAQPAAPPPPPPPISDSASSAATTVGAGLRVTFGAGEADLSPASAAAIKDVVQSAPVGDSTSFNVLAYAAGKPEDPSTARRLSLARALAVRSTLMANGVASSRIYVRALGSTGGGEAPDRVDLAVMGGNAASPASATAPDAGTKSQSP